MLRTMARHLILPAVIASGCVFWVLQENLELAELRTSLESEQETYRIDTDTEWVITASTIDELAIKFDFWQDPANQSDWHLLRTAHGYLERRLKREPKSEEDVWDRLADLSYYIQISWRIRRFQDAEKALDEVLAWTGSMQDADAEGLLLRARALNWKSCLLVNYREPGSALRSARECVAACQQLPEAVSESRQGTIVLLQALRNVGVIEEVLGRDGAHSVERAAELATATLPDEFSEPMPQVLQARAFQVDAIQMLGYLHLRYGRHEAALAAWRRGADAMQALVDLASRAAAEESIGIPVSRFQRAKRRLENDIAQLQREQMDARSADVTECVEFPALNSEAESVDSRRQWRWAPLSPGDGLSELSIDRLINATLPGEFEPQEAILMSWNRNGSWAGPVLLDMLRAIQETTPVVLLVPDNEIRDDVFDEITKAGIPLDQIELLTLGTDTAWTRDYGPLTVRCDDGAVRIACSMFIDSFVDPLAINDSVPMSWSRITGWPAFRVPVLLESGALLSNGAGLCLASELLLRKNAASGIGERQVTAALKRLTGADEVVYLTPLNGEPTEHIDWFTVFTSADTVVIGDYYGIDPVNAQILDDNAGRLAGIMTRQGPLQVERIPMPPRGGQKYFGGTYTNVVFANGNLLVPTWPEASRKLEEKALSVYRRLLPDWKIIPINSYDLGRKDGSLHCATMNLHRYRPPKLLVAPGS